MKAWTRGSEAEQRDLRGPRSAWLHGLHHPVLFSLPNSLLLFKRNLSLICDVDVYDSTHGARSQIQRGTGTPSSTPACFVIQAGCGDVQAVYTSEDPASTTGRAWKTGSTNPMYLCEVHRVHLRNSDKPSEILITNPTTYYYY